MFSSCGKDVERTYYDSGKLKSEYEMKNGLKNGGFKEHYESNGKIMRYSNWLNDTLHGKSEGYYENGQVTFTLMYEKGKRVQKGQFYTESGSVEEIHYYKSGHLYNIEKYNKDGSRSDQNVPLFYLNEDTTKLNNELVFTMRLGNITNDKYRQGAELIIASEVTKYGDPLDTIAIYKSDSNHFDYRFKATVVGKGYVKGCLQYQIPIDTLPGATYLNRYGFVQPYWVRD